MIHSVHNQRGRLFRRALAAIAIVAAIVAVTLYMRVTPVADGPLRWAADAEGGAPYVFKDPKNLNRNIGFEVDLAEALSHEIGHEIQFVQYEYENLYPGLDRRDFDLAMNGLEVTPEYASRVRFSRPYYVYKLQLVVRADDTRFATLADCKAKDVVVGTLAPTAAERLLDSMHVTKKIYGGQVEPYSDLALGRIDAVLLDLPIALYYARPNPKLKFAGPPLAEGTYAIAFRKDQEALAQKFDAAITRLARTGELKRIYQKWGIYNADQERLAEADNVPLDVAAESAREWTFSRYFPLLWDAAKVTIKITVLSMALAVGLGLVIAVMRMYGPAPVRWAAVTYIEFFRGIPVVLLLYFLYFGLPEISQYYGLPVSLVLSGFSAAVLGFGLNYAAYEAEIYRAGIGAVPHGQWEAAASLGMSGATSFRRIILPQAVRTILPPMTNDFIGLFKDTAVVSVIAVLELSKEYQILFKSSHKVLEIGAVTAALYLIMSVPLGYLSRYLERRWSQGVQ